MLGISLFVLVAGLLLYGMYARQQKQIRATETNGENKKPSPATQAAEEVKSAMAPAVSRVADHRGAGGSSTPELKPPAREDRSSAPNARSELAGYSQYQGGELSAEEKARERAYQLEEQAMAAPTAVRGAALTTQGTNLRVCY
jgi:hypothetical protein